jgi:hypothetical protein
MSQRIFFLMFRREAPELVGRTGSQGTIEGDSSVIQRLGKFKPLAIGRCTSINQISKLGAIVVGEFAGCEVRSCDRSLEDS